MIAWWCANTTFWGAAALVGAVLAFDWHQSRRSRPTGPAAISRRPIRRRPRPMTTPTPVESDQPAKADLVSR